MKKDDEMDRMKKNETDKINHMGEKRKEED